MSVFDTSRLLEDVEVLRNEKDLGDCVASWSGEVRFDCKDVGEADSIEG